MSISSFHTLPTDFAIHYILFLSSISLGFLIMSHAFDRDLCEHSGVPTRAAQVVTALVGVHDNDDEDDGR